MGITLLSTLIVFVELLVVCAHVGYHPPDDSDDDGKGKKHGSGCTGSSCSVKHNSAEHVISCNEYNVTASWSKLTFVGDEYEVKLLDNTCNNFRQNKTTVWITADFGTCGSTIIEHRNIIIQKNSAFLTVRNTTGSIAREHVYKYNLQCLFQRKNNASTGYKVIQDIKKTVELAAESAFDVTIDVYTSSSFLLKEVHPITVSMNQPIYVGIKKINDNKHFKMIVEHCFATPTPSANGMSYVFFHNKCPQDPSFHTIESKDNRFNFVIKTFRFIKISKSIYIHCRVFICQKTSKTPQCEQTCGRRKQRRVTRGIRSHVENKIFENVEIKEIQNVTTTRIVFVEKKSCGDLSCPKHSKCIDLYPAVCRCDAGFVFSSIQDLCINQRILKLKGLHLKTRWVYTYANASSHDFLRLATNMEEKLRNVFLRLQVSNIDGVKIISAQQNGGVVVDVSLMHKETSTLEDTSNKLIDLFTNKDTSVLSVFHQSNIKSNPIPVIERDSSGKVEQVMHVITTTTSSNVEGKSQKLSVTDRIQTTITPTLKKKSTTTTGGDLTERVTRQRVKVTTTSIPIVDVKSGVIPTRNMEVITDTAKFTDNLPKVAFVTERIPCILNASVAHQRIKLETTPCGRNNTLAKETLVVYSNKRVLLLSIVLSISFVVVLIVTALVCHYKRNIYYHVLTW